MQTAIWRIVISGSRWSVTASSGLSGNSPEPPESEL
jgi:hypothetical protein